MGRQQPMGPGPIFLPPKRRREAPGGGRDTHDPQEPRVAGASGWKEAARARDAFPLKSTRSPSYVNSSGIKPNSESPTAPSDRFACCSHQRHGISNTALDAIHEEVLGSIRQNRVNTTFRAVWISVKIGGPPKIMFVPILATPQRGAEPSNEPLTRSQSRAALCRLVLHPGEPPQPLPLFWCVGALDPYGPLKWPLAPEARRPRTIRMWQMSQTSGTHPLNQKGGPRDPRAQFLLAFLEARLSLSVSWNVVMGGL